MLEVSRDSDGLLYVWRQKLLTGKWVGCGWFLTHRSITLW